MRSAPVWFQMPPPSFRLTTLLTRVRPPSFRIPWSGWLARS